MGLQSHQELSLHEGGCCGQIKTVHAVFGETQPQHPIPKQHAQAA